MALKDDINNLPTTIGDGNTGHLGNHATIHAGVKSHETRLNTLDTRAPITWAHSGTSTPTLSSFPTAKNGDYIVRKFDAQQYQVQGSAVVKVTDMDNTWRDVSSGMGTSFTGTALIRRSGGLVVVRLKNIQISGNIIGDTSFLALPIGFRPDNSNILAHYGPTDRQPGNVLIYVSQYAIRVNSLTAGSLSAYDMDIVFAATDVLPPAV